MIAVLPLLFELSPMNNFVVDIIYLVISLYCLSLILGGEGEKPSPGGYFLDNLY